MSVDVHHGDCLQILPTLSGLDACICDPPYHLTSIVKRFGGTDAAPAQFGTDGAFSRASRGFMGKQWDGGDIALRPETWRLVYDALKPGAHLVAFGGTRTWHRMACAIEDAGFEYRDTLMWLYGTGFPKSHDISKAIDKSGATDVSAFKQYLAQVVQNSGMARTEIDAACGFTMRFDIPYESDPVGWGVSLPSPEKWRTICRVLLISHDKYAGLIDRVWRGRAGAITSDNNAMRGPNYERTSKDAPATHEAARWQGWGTALKPAFEPIILARKPLDGTVAANVLKHGTGAINIDACRVGTETRWNGPTGQRGGQIGEWGMAPGGGSEVTGRWPANVLHDGSDEVEAAFAAFGESKSVGGYRGAGERKNGYGMKADTDKTPIGFGDTGTASRFFYSAKASKADRAGSKHPTVKPLVLMRWLCRLVTPPGGRILDCFAGSGTTGEAALLEGFSAVLIEREDEYVADIQRRIARTQEERTTIITTNQLDMFA